MSALEDLVALRLKLRIAAGRVYTAVYVRVGALLQRFGFAPDSLPGRVKQGLADRLRPQPKRKVKMLYAALARIRPEATFVQIGANDGVLSDPIYEFATTTRWKGVLVEPVPYLFEKLVRNYPRRPGLSFENVAIASEAGIKPFYYLPPGGPGLPDWHTGLGSFLRDVLVAHAPAIPDIEKRVVQQDVQCVTFEQLCAKHGIGLLDVLNIDAEGYDFEIIKTIDFARHRPLLLVYESHLLTPADRAACEQLLQQAGYVQHTEGLDCICINLHGLQPRDAPLYDVWKVLRDAAGIPA